MKKHNLSRFIVLALVFGLILTATVFVPGSLMAQQAPAAETPTEEPPKPTATEPKPTATEPKPTATEPTTTPAPSEPVSIPEPITVVLFGTGLAALSAAAAARRKKD